MTIIISSDKLLKINNLVIHGGKFAPDLSGQHTAFIKTPRIVYLKLSRDNDILRKSWENSYFSLIKP